MQNVQRVVIVLSWRKMKYDTLRKRNSHRFKRRQSVISHAYRFEMHTFEKVQQWKWMTRNATKEFQFRFHSVCRIFVARIISGPSWCSCSIILVPGVFSLVRLTQNSFGRPAEGFPWMASELQSGLHCRHLQRASVLYITNTRSVCSTNKAEWSFE